MRLTRLCLPLAAVFALTAAHAETPASVSTPAGDAPAEECTGLVLGGGGARGAAHIGVLRELERQRVPICAIAGTSMGAIVGALYATGRSPDQIEAILGRLDWDDLFKDDPPRANLPMRRKDAQLNYRLEIEAGWRDGGLVLPQGVVQGQKLGLLLESWFDGAPEAFDELPIPFRAVAADIVTGEAYIPERGHLADIVRASMAVPAVFAPKEIGDRLLVDGGIVNNVPVSVVRAMGATRVIAVDVGSPLQSREELRTPASIAYQMLSVLMKERTDRELATLEAGDVLITPALGAFSSSDFPGAATVIPIGADAARAAEPALAAFAAPTEQWQAWRSERRHVRRGRARIDFVEVDSTRTRTPDLVANRAAALVGKPLGFASVEPPISSAYAEGTFERIGWQGVERDGRRGVRITPVDKPWGPVFANVGLQLSDDFQGRSDYQLVSELVFTGLSSKGDEVRTLLKLGQVSELSADWFSPISADRDYYFGLDGGYRAQNLPIAFAGQQAAEYRIRRAQASARLGLQRSPHWSLEAGLTRSAYDARPVIGISLFDRLEQQSTAIGLKGTWDTLDQLSFPSSGSRVVFSAQRHLTLWSSEEAGSIYRLRADTAMSKGRHNLLLGARWATTAGAPPELPTYSTLGGFLNLSGALERSLVGPHLAYGRAVYYARLGSGGGLVSVPPYVGLSLEAGNVWSRRSAMSFDDMVGAGSAFIGISSPFGPLLLGWGHTSEGDSSWTLSFGNLIRSDDQ